MFSDPNGIKLEISDRKITGKISSHLETNTLLNNSHVNKYILGETKKIL